MLTPIGQFHSGLAERLGLAGGAQPEAGSGARDHLLAKQAAREALKAETTASGSERSLVQQLGGALDSFEQTAKQIVGKAVDALADDFGGLLEDMGFDGKAAQALISSLLQPLQQALESGADFTAQVSMLAVQQQTAVSGNAFSQDLHLVAKSLEIEVNHTTGEISIGMTSLSIEQSVSGRFGAPGVGLADGAAPLLPPAGELDGGDLFGADLAGFIEDLLERVEGSEVDERAADDEALESLLDDGGLVEALVPESDEADDDEVLPLSANLADDQAVRVEARTRFTIQAVERFQNDLGQAITRLHLDASVRLAAFADLPAQTDSGQTDSAQKGTGIRVLDLKI